MTEKFFLTNLKNILKSSSTDINQPNRELQALRFMSTQCLMQSHLLLSTFHLRDVTEFQLSAGFKI